ncbi:MAG: hypothetical protein KJP18_14240 [Gemmatimonadetes bacterium]|nr:hypothetical protein [Gemmatimonadota bacterium]NNK64105.1 hypothetical protein [Gemmatimonadota bacterium]
MTVARRAVLVAIGAGLTACSAEGQPSEPPDTATAATECAAAPAAWIWCDDFDVDRLGSYFEVHDADGAFVRAEGVGRDGSVGMRVHFDEGQVAAGSLHLAVGRTPDAYIRPADAGTTDYRELFWRVWLRYEPGWIGGGGWKVGRAFVFASPDSWAQAMIAHVWSGGPDHHQLVIDPARGTDEGGRLVTTTYNDFDNLSWMGAVGSATPVFAPDRVGDWLCIEAHVRLNTPGTPDGTFELWIDDQLEARRDALNWLGSFDDYGLNAVFLENYWNGGAPAAQARVFDNFVVSTERIGCATPGA